jgi:class 3 adenylate cyclase
MDAPQIKYAKTSDGVRIAFFALGAGPPLIFLPPMPGHIQREWETEVFGDQFRDLARRYRVIRLDFRNSGLSERSAMRPDWAAVLDIDAVLDHLSVEQVAFRAFGPGGLIAMAYAAQRPQRVSALVLSETFASFKDIASSPQLQSLVGLGAQDYETFTETMGHIFFGWEASIPARQFASILRASMTQEEMNATMTDFFDIDVSDLLPAIRAKTLVLHHRDARLLPMASQQRLVDGIPNARLLVLEGDTVAGLRDDPVENEAIDDFLLGEEARPYSSPSERQAGTAVILFADIVDSTGLAERMGDAAFRERSRTLEGRLRSAIASRAGMPVEGRTLGDGVLATFASASEAIAAALECSKAGENVGLALHLGLHAGDVIREGGNVYGQAVSIASRVSELSAPNEVLVSSTVRDLARASAGVSFEDRGERELKGVSEPVRVFAVRHSTSSGADG